MARNFALTGFEYGMEASTIKVETTTAGLVHLWCRYTSVEPKIHQRTEGSGKYAGRTANYYCFVSYKAVEQVEAGDTLTHTFHVPWNGTTAPIWVTFVGTVGGLQSPSTTAWFKILPWLPSPTPWPSGAYIFSRNVLRMDDTLYVCAFNPDTLEGGVFVSNDYGASFSAVTPAGLPAGVLLLYAVSFPAGYVFITADGLTPTSNIRVYHAPSFNGAWVEMPTANFSPLTGWQAVEFQPHPAAVNTWYLLGNHVTGSRHSFWWVSYDGTLEPVTATSYLGTSQPNGVIAVNQAGTQATVSKLQTGLAIRTKRSSTYPFLNASFSDLSPSANFSYVHNYGARQIGNDRLSWYYTDNAWSARTQLALPAELVGLAVDGGNSEIIELQTSPPVLLGVSNNATPGIWRSIDTGLTWVNVYSGSWVHGTGIEARLGNFRLNSNWAYCTSSIGILISKDGGQTWSLS